MNLYSERMCSLDSSNKNKQLKEMYGKWFDYLKKEPGLHDACTTLISGKDTIKLKEPQLLTCTDAYLRSNPKIMIFGQEANDSSGYFWDGVPDNYQTDSGYNYEKNIILGRAQAKNTQYLKTRKLICGIEEIKKDHSTDAEYIEKLLSVPVNNLNKTSFGGKHLYCNDSIDGIYGCYEYNGLTANVFIHELNILRPQIILLLCGKSYNAHIKRAFGIEIFDKVQEAERSLGIKNTSDVTPVSQEIPVYEDEAENIWGIKNYRTKIYIAMHPSAHMDRDKVVRQKYNNMLISTIKDYMQ